jgi:RNA polymerase sigma factor (sigma-70 family)
MVVEAAEQRDELALTLAAKEGDRYALQLLLERHQRGLYACALTLLDSSWDARDALQETLLEVCTKIATLRDASRFRAWATRILMNKCYDCLRKRAREVPPAEVLAEAPQAHTFLGNEADLDLLRTVWGLEEQRRLAVALRYFVGLDHQQIAEVTGWPLGSVKSRLNRALEHLREALPVTEESAEMDCGWVREHLEGYLAGETSDGLSTQISEHLLSEIVRIVKDRAAWRFAQEEQNSAGSLLWAYTHAVMAGGTPADIAAAVGDALTQEKQILSDWGTWHKEAARSPGALVGPKTPAYGNVEKQAVRSIDVLEQQALANAEAIATTLTP